MNKYTFIILFLVAEIFFWSCHDSKKNVISGLPKNIFTEYNPIPLSKTCDSNQTVRISIPKPHIFIGEGVDSTFQILRMSIGEDYSKEIKISNNFNDTINNKIERPAKKYFEFEMPSHDQLGIIEGDMHIELFYNSNLIDEYFPRFKFLEDGQNLIVTEKSYCFYTIGDREPVGNKTYNYKIEKPGVYYDDIIYSYNIDKKDKYYEVTAKALGGNLYTVNNSKKSNPLTRIPESIEHKVNVPIDFILDEGNYESRSIGGNVIADEDVGKTPGYVFYLDAIGKNLNIHFNNCKIEATIIDTIYTPNLNSWAPLNE